MKKTKNSRKKNSINYDGENCGEEIRVVIVVRELERVGIVMQDKTFKEVQKAH